MSLDRSELTKVIESTARSSFGRMRADEFFKQLGNTGNVMQIFGALGHSQGYKVACHRRCYAEAEDGEWLYDMVWWTANKETKLFESQAMVLECEWKKNVPVSQNADVDGDFHKLVQARADVRVWISVSHNSDLARRHVDNCKKQIQAFVGSQSGDMYVFVIFDWTAETLIESFQVP